MAVLAVVLTAVVALPATPASAIPGHVVRPEYFGVQDDRQTNGSDGFGAARMWAAWCTVQPSPRVPAARAASRALSRGFALNAAAGRNRLTVSLGHPPPWVFGNHARSLKRIGIWYCKQKRSAVAFPSPASLRAGPVRAAYAAYVAGVVAAAKKYLAADRSNRLVLQAWNEPNLGSGGRVSGRIPGTARTWTQAAESLREQERIMRAVARRLIPNRFEITTPSMYGKPTRLGTPYFRLQAKARTVDSVSLNFYTLYVSSPTSSLKRWRSRAAEARGLITRYRSLRGLPIWITETNHNLVNSRKQTNRKPVWAAPAAQKRMVDVTTLEAMRLGYAGIGWYQGSLSQTAVNVRAGTPAAVANRQLRDRLVGRRVLGCGTRKGQSWCVFSARKGSPPLRATWASNGSSGVTFSL